MSGVILAIQQSIRTLGRGRVWLYMLGPAILALLAMIGLAVFLLQHLIALFIEQPPMSWIVAWGAFWLAKLLAVLGGWVVILAATYLVATLLSAIIILPLLLGHLSQTDYPDLARMGSDSVVEGAWNSIWSAVLFIVGWLLTLPLWLVPGLGLILPFFWMAWLNRRTFTFDALAVHATEQEWRELRRQKATPLLGLGLVMGVLAHVPLIGLLAPSLAALAYVHYCLEALRDMRQGAVVTVAE